MFRLVDGEESEIAARSGREEGGECKEEAQHFGVRVFDKDVEGFWKILITIMTTIQRFHEDEERPKANRCKTK